MKNFQRLVRITGIEDAPERIQCRPVPEHVAPLLRETAVFGHEFRSGQCCRSPGCPVGYSGNERHTNPRTQQCVPLIVTICLITGDLSSEILFYRSSHFLGPAQVISGNRRAYANFLAKIRSRKQCIIIKRGGAEIGITRLETVLKFIRIGSHYAFFVNITAAVLQTPLYQRPKFLGLRLVAHRQCISRSTIGYHGGIATVAASVPDVIAFRDDGTRYRLIVRSHETGEMTE